MRVHIHEVCGVFLLARTNYLPDTRWEVRPSTNIPPYLFIVSSLIELHLFPCDYIKYFNELLVISACPRIAWPSKDFFDFVY